MLAAAQAEVPVREATPNEVKVAVTGYGGADKEQVGRMVAVCLGLAAPAKQDDTNDALAIAIWAANAERSGTGNRRSAVLDRASVNPMAAGESSYERAVREALAAERSLVRGKAPARSKP